MTNRYALFFTGDLPELNMLQTEQALQEHKQQSKLIFRRITPNSEPRCSIESGEYTLQCVAYLF
jgi:hypothetical protein